MSDCERCKAWEKDFERQKRLMEHWHRYALECNDTVMRYWSRIFELEEKLRDPR